MIVDSIYIDKREGGVLRQGDVFENIKHKVVERKDDGRITEASMTARYVVVLTQQCDLDSDYRDREKDKDDREYDDKLLESILVCPAFVSANLKAGTHLEGLKLRANSLGGEMWKSMKKNKDARFHFLRGGPKFKMPDLMIDFKRYFTVPYEDLYKNYNDHYKVSIRILYRESLSQRFAYYLSRVGVPKVK